ncbi:hypothetical protein D7S89_25760 [Trinickia fusca]|uniref:Uncharacterized protein n=1 Tax=Trinickia fusca TaxID=2419777 RepID=A0A494X6B0_9BURK|nr:hypothetical protein D7S89_25760 [Trinickia fusca]
MFPPRADIQVGDIYLNCLASLADADLNENKAKRRFMPTALWVATVPGMLDDGLHKQGYLSTNYRSRVQLPRMPIPADKDTSASDNGSTSNGADTSGKAAVVADGGQPASDITTQKGAQAVAKHGKRSVASANLRVPASATGTPNNPQDGIFLSRTLTRAMPVSLPEFFSVSATQAQASAIVPLPTILANLGVSASAVDQIQISVPSAESYGLPAATMIKALNEWKSGRSSANAPPAADVQPVIEELIARKGAADSYCPYG